MSDTWLVVAEARDGKLRQVSLETVQAVKLVRSAGDRIEAVLIGHSLERAARQLAACGAARVVCADHADWAHYNPERYFRLLAGLIDETSPHAIFFGHTAIGRDLAPQIAAYWEAGQISDVLSLARDEGSADAGGIRFTRSLYAGKAFETKRFEDGPLVVTIRPNNIPAAEPDASGAQAEIALLACDPAPDLRTVVRDVVRKASGQVDLTEAKIVVSGGRGVRSAEGFQPLQELADMLGAAVGASRGACDAGYCDYALQIGQTGKVVTPEVYIACGISGAVQHLAGMSRSRVIIAINKDPEAPIFQVADYGIVGDLFEVVPLLTEAFRQADCQSF